MGVLARPDVRLAFRLCGPTGERSLSDPSSRVAEQAAKANAIVDEAMDAGLDGLHQSFVCPLPPNTLGATLGLVASRQKGRRPEVRKAQRPRACPPFVRVHRSSVGTLHYARQ